MEIFTKLITFVRSLGLPGKIISTVIILLVSILLFFFSACASKIHFDSADNFTHEIYFRGK